MRNKLVRSEMGVRKHNIWLFLVHLEGIATAGNKKCFALGHFCGKCRSDPSPSSKPSVNMKYSVSVLKPYCLSALLLSGYYCTTAPYEYVPLSKAWQDIILQKNSQVAKIRKATPVHKKELQRKIKEIKTANMRLEL